MIRGHGRRLPGYAVLHFPANENNRNVRVFVLPRAPKYFAGPRIGGGPAKDSHGFAALDVEKPATEAKQQCTP